MPRLYCPGLTGPGQFLLEAGQAQRLATVLRVRPGEPLRLFPGDGTEWEGEVAAIRGKSVAVEAGRLLRREPPLTPVVEVWCSLIRPARFEWAIEKCTEAGAGAFVPLQADHAARGEEPSAARAERWARLAVEAAEQCGRLYLPEIRPAATLDDALAAKGATVALAHAGGPALTEVADDLPRAERVILLVGPEGGWSERERRLAEAAGAVAIGLGPHVLRTETAAIVGTALLRTIAG